MCKADNAFALSAEISNLDVSFCPVTKNLLPSEWGIWYGLLSASEGMPNLNVGV
jgi:hypothetical protein